MTARPAGFRDPRSMSETAQSTRPERPAAPTPMPLGRAVGTLSVLVSPMPIPTTDRCETATYCATLVDEWARAGVTDAVLAPGSRSTPLVLALAASPHLRTHVVLDERSAGFVGLGLGLVQGRPAVVVTTSGTAAAELHAAVIE